MRVYGGVGLDVSELQKSVCAKATDAVPAYLPIVDLPFSIVGDTLTLPLTIWCTAIPPRPVFQPTIQARQGNDVIGDQEPAKPAQ
jgi:hypothetical protein